MLQKLIEARNALAASRWHTLIFLSVLVVLLRWTSFYHSVIDWDESLYLLVADKWLDGHLPYTVVWDNKPPGIYILFSIALRLFGHSVLSIRILACITIIITCYLLYLVSVTVYPRKKEIGLIAAIFYAAISTVCGGMSANTEIFFIPFIVAAFYLLVRADYFRGNQLQDYKTIFLIGLLLGIAFEIKQVVVFDFLAIICILGMVIYTQTSQRWGIFAKTILLLSIGFVLPFLLVSLYFFSAGNFQNYWYATVTANQLRVSDQTASSSLLSRLSKKISGIYPITIFSLCSFPLLIRLCLNKHTPLKEKIFVLSIAIWFLSDFLGIILVFQRLYSHYFLQLNPIVALAAAVPTGKSLFSIKIAGHKSRFFSPMTIVTILTIGLIITDVYAGIEGIFFRNIKRISHWDDTPAQVSDYLQTKIDKDSYIYVVDYQPIIYFLAKANIPTPYAFPSFLITNPDLANVTTITGIDPLQELEKIMSKKPIYLIKRRSQQKNILSNNRAFYKNLDRYLDDYQLKVSIDSINVYRLSDGKFKG